MPAGAPLAPAAVRDESPGMATPELPLMLVVTPPGNTPEVSVEEVPELSFVVEPVASELAAALLPGWPDSVPTRPWTLASNVLSSDRQSAFAEAIAPTASKTTEQQTIFMS